MQELDVLNAPDSLGNTPLHYAASWDMQQVDGMDYLAFVKALLRVKNVLDLPNQRGETPLLIAAACGNVPLTCYLLSSNADPNSRNSMYAARNHTLASKPVVGVRDLGCSRVWCDLVFECSTQETVLHVCVSSNPLHCDEIVKQLLEADAIPTLTDTNNMSVLELAAARNLEHLFQPRNTLGVPASGVSCKRRRTPVLDSRARSKTDVLVTSYESMTAEPAWTRILASAASVTVPSFAPTSKPAPLHSAVSL